MDWSWSWDSIKVESHGISIRVYFLSNVDNNLGHGSYLISSNGYSWSHTEQSNNISVVGFKFVLNDVIQIEYEKSKIKFWNRNSN